MLWMAMAISGFLHWVCVACSLQVRLLDLGLAFCFGWKEVEGLTRRDRTGKEKLLFICAEPSRIAEVHIHRLGESSNNVFRSFVYVLWVFIHSLAGCFHALRKCIQRMYFPQQRQM